MCIVVTDPYITVTCGISGFYAVLMWYNPDGFWEPLQTGTGRYAEIDSAVEEGECWAAANDVNFIFSDRAVIH